MRFSTGALYSEFKIMNVKQLFIYRLLINVYCIIDKYFHEVQIIVNYLSPYLKNI